MIRLLLRLPIALAAVLALVWGSVLGFGKESPEILSSGLGRLREAYPRAEERDVLLLEAERLSGAVWKALADLRGAHTPAGRAGVLIAAIHVVVFSRVLLLFFLLLAAGMVAGLVFRERMRDAKGYASPAVACFGRVLVAGGSLWLLVFALSPVGGSYVSLDVALLGSGLGGLFYAANLPLQL
ncbi:MAG TPA: hypothetical protein VG457_15835 [Planctomycetota bacterium]|jgi:hypothetical protein|nr:hypothetical protein [Planctomycetota bacterium]